MHSHKPKLTNVVKLQDLCNSDDSDIETSSSVKAPVSSTPKRNPIEDLAPPAVDECYVEDIQQATSSEELLARLRSSFTNPMFTCYKSSSIKVTSISKITSEEMSDTFHILEKKDSIRAFDACKDGFE